jgi:hypothetical protein
MIFEVFTAVNFHIEVFWVVMPYSIVVGYKHIFRLKMDAVWLSEMLVSYQNICGITTQKTSP